MHPTTAFTALLLIPLGASPAVYLIGRFFRRISHTHHGPNPAWIVNLVAFVSALYPLFWAGKAVLADGSITLQRGTIILRLDGLGLLMCGVTLVIGIMVVLFSMRYAALDQHQTKFDALLAALVGAMLGLSCATDLFNLWVWFEAMAIVALLLVMFHRQQAGSLEAGFKYLAQSALGSVLILLGIALVLMQTGQIGLDAIRASIVGRPPLLIAAGALLVIGFGIKAALVPLHTWLPDAHSQAPSGISAMLSGVLIEAALIALLKALGSIAAVSASWGNLLFAFAAANMLLGNLMALRQTEVKRMLAYSSISHVGYMLLGIAVAFSFGLAGGAAGSLFHLITHGLMKSLAFLSVGSLLYALKLVKGQHEPLMLDDLNGAARRYPWIALYISVAALGLGGLPPMAGFMSKWQILAAGVETHNTAVLLLVIFMVFNSVLSLGYYAPLVSRLYRREASESVEGGERVPATMMIPLTLMAVAVVILGIQPGLLNWLTNAAATGLMAALGR